MGGVEFGLWPTVKSDMRKQIGNRNRNTGLMESLETTQYAGETERERE